MNFANILTALRLVLLPFIIVLLFMAGATAAWWCFLLYIIGALTDFFDGWYARKFNKVTELGKLMDPIADKIFVASILVMLIAAGRVEGLWSLAVVVILMREFLVSGLREFLGPKNVKLPVTKLAKWKTTIQMAAIGVLIIAPYLPFGFVVGLGCLSLAALLTVMTGWIYLKSSLPYIK